ncbi:MAG: hypothetical protein HRT45_11110 [Bdellovibrionales bacterium]|nr:hypothetical protein [Bdellovibrionales bacterium]
MTVIFGSNQFQTVARAMSALVVALLFSACGPLSNTDPTENLTDQENHRTGFCLGERCSTANGDTRIDTHLEALLAERNEAFDQPQDPATNMALASSITDWSFLRRNRDGQNELLGSHSVKLQIQIGLETLTFEKRLAVSEDGGRYEIALIPSQENDNYKLMGYFSDIFLGRPGEEENVKTFGTFHLVKYTEGQATPAFATLDLKAYVGRISVRTQVDSELRESKVARELGIVEESLAWVLDLTLPGGRSLYHYDIINVPPQAPNRTLEQQIASELAFWGDSVDTSELVGETLPTRTEPESVTGLPASNSGLSDRLRNVRGWGEGPAGPRGSRIFEADVQREDGLLEAVMLKIEESAPLSEEQQQRVVRPDQFHNLRQPPAQPYAAAGVDPDTMTPDASAEDTGEEGLDTTGPYAAAVPGPPPVQEEPERVVRQDDSAQGGGYAAAIPTAPVTGVQTDVAQIEADTRRVGLYAAAGTLTPAFEITPEPVVAPPTGDATVVEDTRPSGGYAAALPRVDREVISGIIERVQSGFRAGQQQGGGETVVDPNQVPETVRYSFVEHSTDPGRSFLNLPIGNSNFPRTNRAMLQFERYYEKPYIQRSIREILSGYSGRTRNYYDLMMMRSLKFGNPFRGMIEDAFEGWDTPAIFGYRSLWESRFLRDADYPNNQTNDSSSARGLGQFLTDTAGGRTVLMRVGGGVDDERRFAAPSFCGMAKYFNYFVDYFPHDATLGFLAYHAGEGSKRSSSHAGVQGYAKNMLGGLDALRARNYAFTYHELVEANVIPQHKEDWANYSIATTFILQNPRVSYPMADGSSVTLRQPDRRKQIADIVEDMRIRNSEGRVINHKVFHPTLDMRDPKCDRIMEVWKPQFPILPQQVPMS